MLKACFECLGGSLRDDSRQNGGETIAIAESKPPAVRAPPWPDARNHSNMYLVPKQLNFMDKIEVHGTLNDPYRRLLIRFLGEGNDRGPDEQDAIFEYDVIKDENGEFASTIPPLPIYVTEQQRFQVKFEFRNSEIVVENSAEGRNGTDMENDTSLIRFISIEGDVNKVSEIRFIFAN